MKKELSANEILERLKWYHGKSFSPEILKEEFKQMLENDKKTLNNESN